MAKISTFIYSDKAFYNEEKGAPEFENILEIIRPDFIPGNYSFSVIFSITELQIKQNIKLFFVDPDEEIIFETDNIELKLEEEPSVPYPYTGVSAVFDLRNIKIKKEGIHKTVVVVNGVEIGSHFIPVWKGSEE